LIPFSSFSNDCGSAFASSTLPSRSARGAHISSGATLATIGNIDDGTAAVTNPAPARIAATLAIDGAPDFPQLPPTTSTCPNFPLLPFTSRGFSAIAFDEPAHVSPDADCTAASGDPMSATTTAPNVAVVRCPNTCAFFGAVNVTTASARNASSLFSARESASHQLGR